MPSHPQTPTASGEPHAGVPRYRIVGSKSDVIDVLLEHAPRLVEASPDHPHPFTPKLDLSGEPMQICSRCARWRPHAIHIDAAREAHPDAGG